MSYVSATADHDDFWISERDPDILKFKESKRPGLLGLTTVYEELDTMKNGDLVVGEFCIEADAGGIRFSGQSSRIDDLVDLDILAKTISEAWKAHRAARPKILSVTGH